MKTTATLFLLLFVCLAANAQPFQTINYRTIDTIGWLEGSADIVVLDSNDNSWIRLRVDESTSTIRLLPTDYWPQTYVCLFDGAKIDSDYSFSRPIEKYQPVVVRTNDTIDELRFVFQVKRRSSLLDLTGVVAVRHLFPKRESFEFVYNPAN